MATKLTRSDREYIISSWLKGKPVPGYSVIECSNGKFKVSVKTFEVEEEDDVEPIPDPTAPAKASSKLAPKPVSASDIPPTPIPPPSETVPNDPELEPKPQPQVNRKLSKQDAKELLKQLATIFEEEEQPQQHTQKTWNRRRLRF